MNILVVAREAYRMWQSDEEAETYAAAALVVVVAAWWYWQNRLGKQ